MIPTELRNICEPCIAERDLLRARERADWDRRRRRLFEANLEDVQQTIREQYADRTHRGMVGSLADVEAFNQLPTGQVWRDPDTGHYANPQNRIGP